MRRAAMMLAIASGPSFAQDAADFGGTGCVIIAVQGEIHVAEVTCINVVTAGNYHDEAQITSGGISVGLTIDHGPGEAPDRFTVTPPDGYVAQPPVMDLDERTSGVVLVYTWQGS